MKILWSSNAPWAGSGYGGQTAMFAPRIRDLGHDVAINAVWGLQGAGQLWDGIPVYPADNRWGNEMLVEYAANHGDGDPGQCLTITLHDVFVLEPSRLKPLNLACWCPVDRDPLPEKVLAVLQATGARPIAMSRFGEERMRGCGLDPMYVPHAVDTRLYVHDTADARAARKFPDDAFVVGMVAANQGLNPSRKSFSQVFLAFKELRRKHKDALLYLHTDLMGPPGTTSEMVGLNLPRLAEAVGITDGVISSNQIKYRAGQYTAADMAHIYATFDVLANPSYGEGFGIPIIEAQAAGTPVIVTDFTAMPELCGAGWTVGGQPWWDALHNSWYMEPSVAEIADAMIEAYDHAGTMRDQAKAFAAGYDADHVFDTYWRPALDKLEQPREIRGLPDSQPTRSVTVGAKAAEAVA